MDYIWVAVAFSCGFLVKQLDLPPLVGYLAAGFGLHAIGVEPDTSLSILADLGITLLLFTIGLKLNIRNLFKLEIWGSAVGQMSTIVLLTALNCFILAYLGFEHFAGLDWSIAVLIGFAVSFSSTVCAAKILEDRGEMRARHAQVAIGILIIQDIAAVTFVSLATDKPPSWWALSLFALPLARPILYKLLQRCGHGEILLLAGFFLAVTGGQLFELFGLKAHLGALVVGVLLSEHNKAVELSKSLLGFKDIFLIGFFLSIGFTALPTIDMLSTALIMAIALPFKAGIFFLWLTRLKLRGRSAFLAALSLSSYSEFGLIVCSVAVTQGFLADEWLVIMALAVALSFVFSSLINTKAHGLYAHWGGLINRFEQPERLPEDEFSQPDNAAVLVIGMGRVGTGAYDTLRNEMKRDVCGVDVDRERVAAHCRSGRYVIAGDSEDPDFWAHALLDKVELIVLTMPNHLDLLEAEHQLQLAGYQGKTAGIARYADEKRELLSAGIDVVFNFYENAGSGLAEHSIRLIE
jgi:predicted Kef-type K+ transport protein